MDTAAGLVVGLFFLFVSFWLYILLPAGMAERRGRSTLGWILVSVIFSPILACLLLLFLGNIPDAHIEG